MTREEFWSSFADLSAELSVRRLGQILGVSGSTAARWKSKRGSPPRGMRSFVIDELKKRKAKVSGAETKNPKPGPPEHSDAMGWSEPETSSLE